MKQRWALALVAVILTFSLTPAAASMDDPGTQVIGFVNEVRAENGLPPLVVSPELGSSAQAYALAMANQGFFGHVGLDGSRLDTRDEAAGYVDWTFLAENLAAGQTTSQQAVNAWLNSPSHRADLLSPLARDTGVGFAVAPGSKYVFYWVQEFGNRPEPTEKSEMIVASANQAPPSFQLWPRRPDTAGLNQSNR